MMSNSEEDNLCDSMLSAIKNAQKRAKLLNHEDRIALENELGWWLKNDWTEMDVQWIKGSAIQNLCVWKKTTSEHLVVVRD